MFGKYDLDVTLAEDGVKIVVEDTGKRKRYYRKCGKEEVEKFIHADTGRIVVCPVEPVNIPLPNPAEHLQIELDKPLIVASGERDTFYTTFPVEVGVFLVDRKDVERIDLFTKTKPKFTLYGPPESGIICKWWQSSIYSEPPKVKKLHEGIFKVDIRNEYHEWMEIQKLVFCGHEMKMFYNDHAYLHGFIKIQKRTVGDTGFISRKPKDMHGSVDIYLAKGLKRLENYVMEWGFK